VCVVVDENHVGAELVRLNLAENLGGQRFSGGAGILRLDKGITPSEGLDEFIELGDQSRAVKRKLALVLGFGGEIILRVNGARLLAREK
jgi:hypothetical protein